MPATAHVPQIPRDRGRSPVSPKDWQGFLRTADPLAEWRKAFDEWRIEIDEFRRAEQEKFFTGRHKDGWQRSHRGWLCSLISHGEMLAMTLLQAKQQNNAVGEFELLNLCLDNLRDTLQTWHFTELPDLIRSSAD